MPAVVSLSTDQIAAFVELSRQGTLRGVASVLHITEQGVRNRLVSLETRLKVQLYRKQRGPRRMQPLTEDGHRFLPHASPSSNALANGRDLRRRQRAARDSRRGHTVPHPLRPHRRGAPLSRGVSRIFAFA